MESNCPKERFVGTMIPPKPRSSGHRRAYSETLFRMPDEFIFDSDSNFNFSDIDFPSISDDNISGSSSTATAAIPADSGGTSDPSARHPAARNSGGEVHSRSLSLDTAFFDGLGFQGSGAINGTTPDKKPQHRHTSSMDGVTSPFEDESMTPSLDYLKKSVAGDKLAELALIDPKRAKRILANRQSAARSKERKTRYTNELEQKVQTLQAEATTLSAQLTMLQRDSTGLTIENRELKLRLQSMEQQAHLRDALNEALRDEVQRLKITTSQFPNRGFQLSSSPYFSHPPPLPNHGGHQGHQSHSPQLSNQQHLNSARRPPASPNGQAFNDRNNAQDSMDLM